MSNSAKARAHVCAPPSPSASRVGLVVGLALGFCLGPCLVGCSDDAERRDQYYGTDTGVGYQLPDTGVPTDSADARDAGAGAPDSTVTGSKADGVTQAPDATPDGDVDAVPPPVGPDATVDGVDDDAAAG
jgi:hypothetical protein